MIADDPPEPLKKTNRILEDLFNLSFDKTGNGNVPYLRLGDISNWGIINTSKIYISFGKTCTACECDKVGL